MGSYRSVLSSRSHLYKENKAYLDYHTSLLLCVTSVPLQWIWSYLCVRSSYVSVCPRKHSLHSIPFLHSPFLKSFSLCLLFLLSYSHLYLSSLFLSFFILLPQCIMSACLFHSLFHYQAISPIRTGITSDLGTIITSFPCKVAGE